MKLIYRTRGNAAPQGKPRVYLTGHPADLPSCMEEIFSDIFLTQNCAVYYDEEPLSAADQDDLLRELEQMQLIVIPVTSRFLYQPNRARDVEFPFAMERHIPVLPLMQEDGLEAAFNEKCGDLQMLNKQDPDPTALPYAEKLEKFLASVLVGDELAERVRAAFDAYVFLSYRKKDRRYAQELMRLIHKNDFCRDIAIWYDEFLTPGENFNDAIADALKKCGLFTLAVTPNIVEPGNYVMALEYPEAKKSGKPILPVELVPTDKEALQNSFRDIPPIADAHNEQALSAALLEEVQKLAIRENDGSPAHNFFIGLAYLNGIDVEVDRVRALSLITGAAEGGLPEAMKKLVSMYQSGDGVERNYRTAVQWQERLVALRETQYYNRPCNDDSSEDEGISYTAELCSLGDYLQELADLAGAEKAYQQMNIICGIENVLYDSETVKRSLSISHKKMGGIYEAMDMLSLAKEDYLKALEIDRQLCEETGTAQARRDLSLSYNNLGNISKAEGRLTEAEDYYLQSLELCKQLAEETRTTEARRDLSVIYEKLGYISKTEGRLTEAKDYHRQTLEINRLLYEEIGTVQAQRDLSFSYNNLGNISKAEGRLDEAKNYYLQGLELRKQLAEEIKTPEAQRDLSVSYKNLGYISKAEGRLTEAKNYYLQALELRKPLYESTKTPQSKRDLSFVYKQLVEVSKAAGQISESRKYRSLAAQLDY